MGAELSNCGTAMVTGGKGTNGATVGRSNQNAAAPSMATAARTIAACFVFCCLELLMLYPLLEWHVRQAGGPRRRGGFRQWPFRESRDSRSSEKALQSAYIQWQLPFFATVFLSSVMAGLFSVYQLFAG